MLGLLLLLTFVMLQHALLQLLSFKIAFLKSDQRAFCNVGVDGHRKVAHLGLVFLISDHQFEQDTLEKEKYSKPIFAMRNATKRRRIQKGHAPRPAGQQLPPPSACL